MVANIRATPNGAFRTPSGHHFDRNGRAISMLEWALLVEHPTYSLLAHDRMTGVSISTVWLGLNHGGPVGHPVIFETMVFGGEHDEYRRRYCTEAIALAGHRKIVDAIAQGKELP